MSRAVYIVALAVALLARPAAADEPDLYAVAAALRPGQASWSTGSANVAASADAAMPTLRVIVSLELQRLYVYRQGELVGVAAVSTGRPGHVTPSGDFAILQKARWHRSNLYSGAPMPFMQRLTWDGIALHAGHNPGVPASHGCVRLPPAFANALFAMTSVGDAVAITDYPPITLDLDPGVIAPDLTVSVPRLSYSY